MNILYKGINSYIFESVIDSDTSKEVWDTIQTLCEGSEQVRKNKMQFLIQQYEHFYYIPGKGLSETFNRFQKLLNGLELYGRIYQVKDSNIKFLRSLPREWKPQQFLSKTLTSIKISIWKDCMVFLKYMS